MVFVYPDSTSTFVGSRATALEAGYVEVGDTIYADLVETRKMWKDGKIVNDPTYPQRKAEEEAEAERRRKIEEIQRQVTELKVQLSASDYKAIKYAEGWISEEEYAPIRTARQELRDQINALENADIDALIEAAHNEMPEEDEECSE